MFESNMYIVLSWKALKNSLCVTESKKRWLYKTGCFCRIARFTETEVDENPLWFQPWWFAVPWKFTGFPCKKVICPHVFSHTYNYIYIWYMPCMYMPFTTSLHLWCSYFYFGFSREFESLRGWWNIISVTDGWSSNLAPPKKTYRIQSDSTKSGTIWEYLNLWIGKDSRIMSLFGDMLHPGFVPIFFEGFFLVIWCVRRVCGRFR